MQLYKLILWQRLYFSDNNCLCPDVKQEYEQRTIKTRDLKATCSYPHPPSYLAQLYQNDVVYMCRNWRFIHIPVHGISLPPVCSYETNRHTNGHNFLFYPYLNIKTPLVTTEV